MLRISTARRVADVLWPEFVERDGVILLSSVRLPAPLGTHATLTEYERFHGHTHIQDVFSWDAPVPLRAELDFERPDPDSPQHAAAWAFAQRMDRMWLAKLCADFPAYRFRVYVSRLDDPIVHFHRVREQEPLWISDEEAAAQVAHGDILVLDSGEPIPRPPSR